MKTISKSNYVKGQQCLKALWLSKNRKDIEVEYDALTLDRFADGGKVEKYAYEYYPNGVEIKAEYWDIAGAVKLTNAEVEKGTTTIYEASAITSGDYPTYARIDILKQVGDGKWDMVEIKSSTAVKDYHIEDLSLQYYVFTQAGYDINKCYLMHVNNQYIRKGTIDAKQFLNPVDITDEVLEKQIGISGRIKECHDIVGKKDEPVRKIGGHCKKPFECDYKKHCWKAVPDYSIFNLFNTDKAAAIGVQNDSYKVEDLPVDQYPGGMKYIDMTSYLNNEVTVNKPMLAEFVDSLIYPLYYFDYETISPAIPLFDNLSPHQRIPFQWSLHIEKEEGAELEHIEFLHQERTDPREDLIKKLISSCGSKGSVIVYNQGFEEGVNRELAKSFPKYADKLLAINERMEDLLIPFRKRWLYHPNQKGSASIKAVLPAFTDVGYDDLEIGQGGDASSLYRKFIDGSYPEEGLDDLWESLLLYCGLDTKAMKILLYVIKSRL